MTATFKKLVSPFFIIPTLLILGLNLTPLVILKNHAPEGRNFSLIHNNAQDFFFYQSLMNQGARGDWLISDPYTTENHQSSLIFSFFTWFGKIAKLFNLANVYIYHSVRILAAFFLLFAIFKLIHYLKIPYPNLAYIFFLFASPLLTDQNLIDRIEKAPFMYWWTGMDPVRRAAYLPHHSIGAILLIITVFLIFNFFRTKNIRSIIAASILALPMAFFHTPSLFLLLLVLPPSMLIYLVSNLKNLRLNIRNYWALLIFWLAGSAFLILMVSQANRGFPWSQYLVWEKTLQYPLMQELWGALGILFPLALIGTIISITSKKFERILIACLFAFPFLLIPLAPSLNISNIRLIQGIPYLWLSILAVIAVDFLSKLLSLLIKSRNPSLVRSVLLRLIILLIFIFYSYPTIVWSIKDQVREYWPIYGNVYLDDRLFEAFEFINRNYPAKTKTLATFYSGNYLPAFTHTVSYLGHNGYTYEPQRKEKEMADFFAMKMTVEKAKALLLDNKITLVFQGPEEKPFYNGKLYPEFLKPVYDREAVTVYEF